MSSSSRPSKSFFLFFFLTIRGRCLFFLTIRGRCMAAFISIRLRSFKLGINVPAKIKYARYVETRLSLEHPFHQPMWLCTLYQNIRLFPYCIIPVQDRNKKHEKIKRTLSPFLYSIAIGAITVYTSNNPRRTKPLQLPLSSGPTTYLTVPVTAFSVRFFFKHSFVLASNKVSSVWRATV